MVFSRELQLCFVVVWVSSTWAKVDVESLQATVNKLARQLMLQQQYVEERIRSDGDSGVKQCRINNEGTKVYHLPSHTSKKGIAALHDHSNHIRTIGLGEVIVVMNGVEFRTRHNDYILHKPSTTSKEYHATEEIQFPDVPPEVTQKAKVEDQIEEMREWFKAWRDQNHTVRDYRQYFKPILCYMEGAWTTDAWDDIEEPFKSDRHWLDATSWEDLQNKIRFTSYNGRKSSLENYAYLPSTILDIINGSDPVFAQWNYRILCHPLTRDLRTNRFRIVDDLSPRMMYLRTLKDHGMSRRARFQLNPRDKGSWIDRLQQHYGLLDELMSEIPGKDNYGAQLTDEAFDNPAHTIDLNGDKVNTAYYHRWWKEVKPGAMGLAIRKRGFSDRSLFMAMTTQPRIAGMGLRDCKNSDDRRQICQNYQQKWTYAIPLEVIYLTPLSTWNPYGIEYKGDAETELGQTVTENESRYGGITSKTAYNGANSKLYNLTPAEFFQGRVLDSDKADTFRGSVGVLDPEGNVRALTSSGVRVSFPNIPGVGILRQRYPIMPLHNEGNPIWKELDSLKDIVMEHTRYLKMYRERPGGSEGGQAGSDTDATEDTKYQDGVTLMVLPATRSPPGPHVHWMDLSPSDVDDLKNGLPVTMITTEEYGHSHMIKIRYKPSLEQPFTMNRCDGEMACWDGHTGLSITEEIL
ncbi:uncharacterized protein LOC106168331 [Lingula anatina]|uniref:Uncharacterized protein LOC106168331 n=1 Tax=Lingula anatina TaxID=7574 RepID=A0A1S3IXV3_LINAN|nr:uncharacterized protein LOC106168331 [Lingula anatina]|eukprot:XP_013402811.1 uncharacterized protein LOC106168331 [Lingula anatina]